MNEQEQQNLLAHNAFMRHNHIKMILLERDHTVFALDIAPESLNSYGALHGGAYYTLADSAGGAACRTDGRYYVTLEGSLHYLRAVREGRVEASARVRHRGGSTCLVNVELTDQAGGLVAIGDFTFFCLGEKPPNHSKNKPDTSEPQNQDR